MKHIIRITGLTLSIVIILSNPAYAYLDPGTGSMLIQAVIAIITVSSVFLGMFWGRVKTFVNTIFGKKHASGEQYNDEHE